MIPSIIIQFLLSLGAGIFLGIIYAILFLLARAKVPKGIPGHAQQRYLAASVFYTALRFGILAVAAWYFFSMSSINQIIMILSFLITFWIIVFKHKAFCDEGHGSFRR